MILFIGTYLVPETLRWLMSRGREAAARDVLMRSRSEEENEIHEIQELERQVEGGLRKLTASRARPALIVAVGLGVFQQITVINTIIYYALTLTNA